MEMADFIQKYIIDPIINGTGYNIVNTTVLALGFVLVVILTTFIFKKAKIKIDKEFFIGLAPFIVLGSVARTLEDAEVLTSYWFVTPMIYILIYFAVLASLGVSIFASRKVGRPYWQIMCLMGIIPMLYAISFIKILYFQPFLFVISLTLLFSVAVFILRKKLKPRLLSEANSAIIITHLFDASTTFTAIELSRFWGARYFEQHVLAGFLMASIGSYAIFLLKIAVVPLALWAIDRYSEDKQVENFLKIAVFILGFGPGLRNMLSMMVLPA